MISIDAAGYTVSSRTRIADRCTGRHVPENINKCAKNFTRQVFRSDLLFSKWV